MRRVKKSLTLRLGSLTLKSPALLAPMAGITDAPFRILCREGGAGMVVGEMVSSQAIHHGSLKSMTLMKMDPKEHPAAIQIFGSRPDFMADAARRARDCGADCVDINAGCPVPKILKSRSGAALLKDESLFAEILTRVCAAVDLPVTVKIRLGWKAEELLAPALAKLAESCGVSAVIVHARTVAQKHSGLPNLEGLARVVQAVQIPIIGNGGIETPEDCARFIRDTGCAGVSIGRAAIGDPGIFRRCHAYLAEGKRLPPPDDIARLETFIKLIRLTCLHYGPERGLRRMRKVLPYFVTETAGARSLRFQLNRSLKLQEWEDRIQFFQDAVRRSGK